MAQRNRPLYYLTIGEASRLLQRRELSPVELTRAFLERIQAVDGKLKAYVTLLAESAMAEARQAEQEIGRGQYRGPLHGIPLAHKDLYDTRGVRTTAQSKVFEHRVPTEDATVIARLREAGSVLLGKLAMYEFAFGGSETSLFEQARNPWNLDYITGGSSSGSGAAVAAGLCMGSLGSDTGGSIRIPASMCGIVGLKPTYGRVSRYGVIPLSWSLDHVGPMTWTVEDAAIMLQAIAGYDPKDPHTRNVPVPDYTAALQQDIRGLRLGVPRHFYAGPNADTHPEVVTLVDQAVNELEKLGATVEELRIPTLEEAGHANNVIALSEAASYHHHNLQAQPHNYGEPARMLFYLGSLFTSLDYVQAQRYRNRLRREVTTAFRHVDALVYPTIGGPAAPFEGYDIFKAISMRSHMAPANSTGLPAISVPCGFTQAGLPIGLQVLGQAFDEPTILRVAHAYQQRAKWHMRRPPI